MSAAEFVKDRILRKVGPHLPSTPIWDLEWDVLCVLDGCRIDTFRATVGDCDRLQSVGSTSRTWIRRTFAGRDCSRVGYVTGNPFSGDEADPDAFGHYRAVGVREVADVETVPPRDLADLAIRAWRDREDLGVDRLVVHFMQPHVPFRSRPEWFAEWRGTDTWGSSAWERLATGAIDRREWFDAYRDNLRWAWEEGVTRLGRNCDARIAVTSDHGNAAGEWGFYGHPSGAPVAAVRDVPWKMIDGEDTGRVAADVTLQDGREPRDVAASLRALGYRQEEGGG